MGGMGGMVLGIDEKFFFREKMGLPLIISFKNLGVTPNHQTFRWRLSGARVSEKKTFLSQKCETTEKTDFGAGGGNSAIIIFLL